jgi:hypothetical protein
MLILGQTYILKDVGLVVVVVRPDLAFGKYVAKGADGRTYIITAEEVEKWLP